MFLYIEVSNVCIGFHLHACQSKWTGQFQDSFAGLEAFAEDLHGDIVILTDD